MNMVGPKKQDFLAKNQHAQSKLDLDWKSKSLTNAYGNIHKWRLILG